MVVLATDRQTVQIDAGELISYRSAGHEFIHQKGSPGWRNSDTEMFPLIGPTAEAGFRVQTPRGTAIQDQHGLLRELSYELVSQSRAAATFKKTYKAGTEVRNSKYPDKSNEEWLAWPYDFSFVKSFELSGDSLSITFRISGEADMPFMLGYHPAFRLYTEKPVIQTADRYITLEDVLAVGSRALPVLDCQGITLNDERSVALDTEGFRHFMLWTEVPNMICIEPITFYPYAVEQTELHSGFQTLDRSEAVFRVRLLPSV